MGVRLSAKSMMCFAGEQTKDHYDRLVSEREEKGSQLYVETKFTLRAKWTMRSALSPC